MHYQKTHAKYDKTAKYKFVFYIGLTIFFCLFSSMVFASNNHEQGQESTLVHLMVILVFQLSAIIFAAQLGGAVAEKYKLPSILGEIVAGSIIGPYLLGGIPLPLFEHGLFPLHGDFPVSIELYGFTTIAAIVLLFLVGLETDIETFLNYSLAGSVVGVGGVVMSFILGDLAMVLFSPYLFGTAYGFTHPVPLFMGVISIATSVGISARILSEKRKMDSIEGVTIISGAVIDDVLGIVVLAVILGIVRSGHIEWKEVSFIGFKAISVWLIFSALGLYFADYISTFLKKFKDKNTIAIMALACAFLLSGIFEKSGLAMIIGAYIMGISLSKTDLSLVIQERLSILYSLLVPIFFCVMGMLINFKELMSLKIITFGLIYLVFAFLGKILGCSVPALFLNFNLRGALRVGFGMLPRGEVTLIIAGIGLSAGIIGNDSFNIAVIMTFVTTLITPPILAKMLESDKPVLRKEKQIKTDHQEIVYTMPNEETAELILSKTLFAFEGEGFYVNTFHNQQGLYQIRKGKTFIGLNYSAQKLLFDCLEKDVAFVHTVFYEVLAELENVMKNLQRITDKENIGKKIFEKPSHLSSSLQGEKSNISQIISPLTVEFKLKATSKPELFEEMVALFVHSGQINETQRKQALIDLLKREETMSTGMQNGIALPHTKTKAVQKMMCAIGVKKEGIDFASLDQKPSHIFMMTLTPLEGQQQSYLQFMAEMSKFFTAKENLDRILNCQTNDDLYHIFTSPLSS